MTYLSNDEKRDRSLSWIPLEDIDFENKGVKNIKFSSFGVNKKTLKFSATFQ